MTDLLQLINPFAVILAALLGFAISGFWHSWLVPKAWFHAHQLQHTLPGGRHHTLASRSPVLALVILVLAYLLTAVGLAVLQVYWPVSGWAGALSLAAVLILLVSIPQQLLAVVSYQLGWQAWLLDVSNRGLALLVMNLVVFLWR